jgi:phosphoglycerate dehydrogenase-like enzyme
MTDFSRRLAAFDMKVNYYDVMRYEVLERLMSIEYVTLDGLLSKSDFVSIHTPLTKATRSLIGERVEENEKEFISHQHL